MMFGYNYDRPGKGVNKRDPNRTRFSIFFELLFRKFWDLCRVNLLYLITSIPTFVVVFLIMGVFSVNIIGAKLADSTVISNETVIIDFMLRIFFSLMFLIFIGQGPTTAGFTYALRNFAREEHVFLFSDWWEQIKINFRQSIIVWIFDLIVVNVLIFAIMFYLTSEIWAMSCIMIALLLLYLLMHFYVYQLMITFENSIKNTITNAFIMSLIKGPRNLLMFLIMLIIHIGIPYMGLLHGWGGIFWIVFVFCEIFILPSLTGFMVNFFVYPDLERYIPKDDSEQ